MLHILRRFVEFYGNLVGSNLYLFHLDGSSILKLFFLSFSFLQQSKKHQQFTSTISNLLSSAESFLVNKGQKIKDPHYIRKSKRYLSLIK